MYVCVCVRERDRERERIVNIEHFVTDRIEFENKSRDEIFSVKCKNIFISFTIMG